MVPKLIAKYYTCFQPIMAEIIAILGLEIQNATKLTCETSETLFYHFADLVWLNILALPSQ